jgi:hypothetical protein
MAAAAAPAVSAAVADAAVWHQHHGQLHLVSKRREATQLCCYFCWLGLVA